MSIVYVFSVFFVCLSCLFCEALFISYPHNILPEYRKYLLAVFCFFIFWVVCCCCYMRMGYGVCCIVRQSKTSLLMILGIYLLFRNFHRKALSAVAVDYVGYGHAIHLALVLIGPKHVRALHPRSYHLVSIVDYLMI